MKPTILLIVLIVISACEPNKNYSYYGEVIDDKPTHSFTQIYQAAQSEQIKDVVIKGEISQTCAKKGCWMDIVVPEGDTLIVRFKDYGFFVPKEGVEGKEAIMHGYAKMDTISVDMLRHYAEDAGDSEEEIMKINEPRYTLEFIADGVLIEK